MFFAEASRPVTSAPSRAIGSETSPPPQPTSRSLSPSSGRRAAPSRPNASQIVSRRKVSRTGLNRCSGANLPSGSHHSAAMAENFSTSSGSTLGSARGASASSVAKSSAVVMSRNLS
jgi:hypothetical protein